MTVKGMLCVRTCIDNMILYYIPIVYSIYGVKDGEIVGHIYHALRFSSLQRPFPGVCTVSLHLELSLPHS